MDRYKVIVLPGVNIGDGAVIGAGSVVANDVPPYSITAGVPAVYKKSRFSEPVVEDLLELAWWDWPLDKIRRNTKFFTTDLTTVENLRSLVVD